jgi:TonB-dependent starch-binding outer membrane protein SusC
MEKNVPDDMSLRTSLKNFFKIMKITIFFVVLTVLQTFAVTVSSQSSVLTLNIKETKIEQILFQIENETNYVFLYNKDLINVEKVASINVKGASINEVLNILFEGSNINYKMLGRQIVLSPSFSIQQTKISGRVTNNKGEPLPGVSIVVKGTNIGTITSAEGTYQLSKVDNDATLVFSFVGMVSQEKRVQGDQVLNVTLEEDTKGLEEVVVIGYGTSKRKDFTGSVGSLKMENSPVSLLPNTNALESLKGNVSGLNIGASNSAGGEPDMLIRGQRSINGSNDPLIVLDGVIYLGSLSDINPNDIATVDILKDAVSSAAYGSRSANGVIAITTKRGNSAKPIITLNTSSSVQIWQNRPTMMKGDQWIQVVNARNGYTEGSTYWMTNQEAENYTAGKERVWLDDVTRMGIIQNIQLAISGSSKGLNYYLSTAYEKNKGVVVGDDFTRISALGKINAEITSWLKVGVDASFARRDYSGFGADLTEAQKLSPYGVMYRNSNGDLEKYPTTQSSINPLWGVNDGTRENMDIRQNFRLNTNALINVPWIKGLSYRINFLTNLDLIRLGNFYHEDYFVAEGDASDESRYASSTIVNYLSSAYGNLENKRTYSYVWDNIVSYKDRFGKHDVEVTLVATRDHLKYEDLNSKGSDFSDNGNTTLGMYGLQYATVQKLVQDGYKKANIGYLGRLSYSFNDRYYLTSSIRRDGASVFGANKKWGNFSAVGLAWKITEENFMKNIDPLNNLKLKLSWGQNGNQGIDPYTTLSQVASGSSGGYRYEFSDDEGTVHYGMVQSSLGNYDLGWESTETYNFGFESAWLKNRLFIDVDTYFSKTTDQIFERNIPVMTGFKTMYTSLGQVNNKGIEVTIKSTNVNKNNWKWMTSLTFWKNKNKLVKLYGVDSDGDGKEDDDLSNSLFIGKSLGAIYGYKQEGIVQEENTEYMALTGASAGDPKYKDLDNVQGITSSDREILGYTKENFRLNITNTVNYKNFEFYVLISGIFGGNNYYMKSNTTAYMTAGTGRANDNMTYKPYWTSENRSNVYPSATFSGDSRFLGLQSRGFVRIQDISIAYSFHQPWIKLANINSFKVFFAAKNLATFTNWDGGDPETGALYLSSTYPVVSTYSLGLNIGF